MLRALLVDAGGPMSGELAEMLEGLGYATGVARTLADSCELIRREPYDLVLIANGFAPAQIRSFLDEVRSVQPATIRLRIASDSSRGAHDAGVDLAREVAADPTSLAGAIAAGRAAAAGTDQRRFVAASAAMQQTVQRLRRVAPLDTTVLLLGESGSGKEVAATYLHENHPRRRKGPLVSVHCGAIPETLLESELFGHVRGAFTGADRDRAGRFEQADGGTLFLDEISTMKPEAGIRLLRILQERRVARVGSSESRPVDVRVIVATNQNLQELVDRGAFRLDLYYRINTFPVMIPALRDRAADIPALAEIFARRFVERNSIPVAKRFAMPALRAMFSHAWPGNVRELENVVEYAAIESGDRETILLEDLPPDVAGCEESVAAGPGLVLTERGLSLRTAVGHLERDLILQSLRMAGGNKARAAKLLDLSRTTFLEKMRRLESDGLLEPDHAGWSSEAEPAVPVS